MARQPLGGLGRLIFEASRSHFRHTTRGRTPLDEGPARRRDLYLTRLGRSQSLDKAAKEETLSRSTIQVSIPRHEDQGLGGIAPHISNLGNRWM
jgi:hypothetical protein